MQIREFPDGLPNKGDGSSIDPGTTSSEARRISSHLAGRPVSFGMAGKARPGAATWLGRDSKFDPARPRPGTITRERLLRRIAAATDAPITLISASAGYGKSTLTAQMHERSQRPLAWINLDRGDNDPITFLNAIAHALHTIDPLAPELLAELAAPAPRILDVVLPAITFELECLSPVDLVLDDAHELTEPGSLDVLDLLLQGIGPGTHVTLVTRADLHLPLARRRLVGDLLEISAGDLAFDMNEIGTLAAVSGKNLSEEALRTLLERTEGWPAGIALGFQALDETASADEVARTITGDRREFADYLIEVVLDRESPERRHFLLATSVLEEMTAPLCDAVAGIKRSGEILAQLEHTNSFVVALDDHRRWYRNHPLFAELLRTELERSDPDLARESLSRAASWHEKDGGNAGEAFRCARECGRLRAGRTRPAGIRRREGAPRPARDSAPLAARLQRRGDRVRSATGPGRSMGVHAAR